MDQATLTKLTGIELIETATKNWFQGFTKTGLKVEFKVGKKFITVIAAYNISDSDRPRFYEGLSDRWELTKAIVTAKKAKLTELDALVKEAESVFANGEWTLKGSNRGRKTADEGYFEKTAIVLKMAIELEHWDFVDRGTLGFDAHDKLITIGKSKAFEAAKAVDPEYTGWREHIVPCTMIIEEAIRMVQEGTTIVDLAQMLKTNLAIVMLTTEEAAYVDSTYKTAMPQGWSFGDGVTARLDAMGVAY